MMRYYFIDFDDTICLHAKSIDSKRYIVEKNPYCNSVVNKKLLAWLKQQKIDNVNSKFILLTAASSFMLDHKINWCKNQLDGFEFDDYVSVSYDCSKAEYISMFLNDENEIVVVDDNQSERNSIEILKHSNIQIYSPQYLDAIL